MKGSCTEAEFRTRASRAIETRDLHAQVGYIRDRNGPREGRDLCSIWVYAVTHTQIVQAIISIDNRQTTLGPPRSVHRIPVTNVLSDLLITHWRNYLNKLSSVQVKWLFRGKFQVANTQEFLVVGCCCCYLVFIVVVFVVVYFFLTRRERRHTFP